MGCVMLIFDNMKQQHVKPKELNNLKSLSDVEKTNSTFISNTFISNTKLKLARKYWPSLSTLSSKNNRTCF